MNDEAEVDADDEICDGDQVGPRQLQELQGLDQTEKIVANPAIEHHLGHCYPGQQMHKSTVVVGKIGRTTKKRQER